MSEDIEEQKKEETQKAEENKTTDTISFESLEHATETFIEEVKKARENNFEVEPHKKLLISAAKDFMIQKLLEAKAAKDNDAVTKIWNDIQTPTKLTDEEIKKAEASFDLKAHMSGLFNNIFSDMKEFSNEHNLGKALNENIGYGLGMYMYDIYVSQKIISGPEAEKNQAKCRETLEKMITGENSGKIPNKELAELVEKCGGLEKVKFNIVNENRVDGHASFSKNRADKGGNGIVINITKGAFENDYKGLPMLLGHELGHILDFSKRPEGYPASLKDAEEYFADYMGNQLVNNGNFTEKEKYEAKKAFIADTKEFKDNELCQSRVKIMTDYMKIQHPQQYYGKYMQTLRGMGNALGQPEKPVKGNEQIKEMDILSKLRGKNSRE